MKEHRARLVKIVITAILSGVVYLLVSQWYQGLGFPLDDAWIHQVYARNIARGEGWEFITGNPSGGSTGPLWSMLLAVPYLLGISPIWGAYFWGLVMLTTTAWTGSVIFERLLPEVESWPLWVGIGLVTEWHLVWAALSGMETLLFSSLILSCVLLVEREERRAWLAAGLTVGLSIWVRPGGLTLLGLAGWAALFSRVRRKEKARNIGLLMAGFFLMFLPYLGFNQLTAGDWWPNTFYAKQAEYAVLRQRPFFQRLTELGLQPIIGLGLPLVPGFLAFTAKQIARRRWRLLAGPLWCAGYIFLYAWRLPVTYQHGRYLIPAIPLLVVYGMAGMAALLKGKGESRWEFVLSRSWVSATVLLAFSFWVIGAGAYGRDVAVIETEMVHVAQWADQHLEEDALVAAHDIGALGFYTDLQILDLAGLVSPEVIPFIRKEDQLAAYMSEQQADYLIAFPGWYPDLVDQAELVYQSGGEFAPILGQENLSVYRWQGNSE